MKTFTIAPKACRRCGEPFRPVVNNQVACVGCRHAEHLDHNRASRLRCYGYVGFRPKACAVCSVDFIPTTSRSKYCPDHVVTGDREKRLRWHRKTWNSRRRNPTRIVKAAVRQAISRMAIRKTRPSLSYVGYTAEQLRAHIERLFLPGMTWENYGEWHIDHRTPLAKFAFVRPDGSINSDAIREASALDNLQPLWAVDNLRKGAR